MTEFLRTWAEIDLGAVNENLNNIKYKLGKDAKIMAVVKANAYGHGAIGISKSIEGKVDGFAVATIEEAVELRKNEIKSPILILGCIPEALFPLAVKFDIMTTITTISSAKALSDAAISAGKTGGFYLAVDTGMSRIGVPDSDAGIDEIKAIVSYPAIKAQGIYSHFAKAEAKEKTFTGIQTKRFGDFLDKLEKQGINIPVKTLYNSSAAVDLDMKYDMARVGIVLYGLYPSDEQNKQNLPLKPVMSLKTKVTYVKTVEAGTGISYGHTYYTKGKTRIATLAVGYADGLPIGLSNKGRVIIRGKYANIVGRVCMDQMMADVTDIPDVSIGDTATIIGRDGECAIPVEEVAALGNTINYDIICGIDCRVPRVFMQDGKIVEIFSYIANGLY